VIKHLFITKKKLFLFVTGLLIGTSVSIAQDTTSADFEITNPLETVPQQYEILGVEVTGLTTTNPSFVISTSGLEEGRTITHPGESIPEAVRQLKRTGLFTDIKILRKKTTAGGIYLEIQVKEQPKLENFVIRGVKKSQRKDLREKINLLTGFAVTESTKARAVQTIKDYYQEEGYWFTEVELSTSKTDTVRNRVTLYFDIEPGEKLEIKDITIEGNEFLSDRELIKELDAIKEDSWWKFFSKKLFKEDDFETAKQNLRAFYAENGFVDFRILSDTVFTFPYTQRRLFVLTNDATGLKVRLKVSEGPQYKVRNITWEGNTVYTDEQLTQTLGFQKGDIFNQSKFQRRLEFDQQGGNDVTSLYQNIGYLFFSVTPEFNVVGKDSLDIHLNIIEDEIATIEEVSFTGNTKTHDDVVRRNLRTVPGQKFSRAAIMRTIRELGSLGYFRPESIQPNVNPNREDHTVDINYQLDESQSTDNFEFSGGFGGRGIGAILSARVNFNNFSLSRALKGEGWNPVPSGDGQRLTIGAQLTGNGFQTYSLGFQEPWLSGRPISLGVNFSYNLQSFNGNKNELVSSSVSIGKRLKWPDDFFTTRTIVSHQLFDITGRSTFLAQGTSNILSIEQVLERNSTDNPISPTTGSLFELSGEVAPPFPDFSQFFKFKTKYQNHTTVVGKLVLTNTAEYGYVGFLGEENRSDFQLFELGGTQLQQRQTFLTDNIDMRGFPGGRTGSISPRVDGEFVGGRFYNKYTTELRIQAVSSQQLRLIPYVFFDAGNSYLDFQEFSPFDLKRATGFGSRLFLPILGLIDISFGYRLDGIEGTNIRPGEWEFLFNIGAPF